MYRKWALCFLVTALLQSATGISSLSAADRHSQATSSPGRTELLTKRLKFSAVVGVVSMGIGSAFRLGINEANRDPLFGGNNGVDRFFRRHFGDAGKTSNVVDSNGTVFTLAAGLGAVILMQNLLSDGPVWRNTAYEVAVFGTGFMTELGVRLAVKSSFARRRPFLEFASPQDATTLNANSKNHLSFYSGHTSTAFYTAAYADQRIGDLLKARSLGRYRLMSIIPLYGWASYMAFSRVQIDKHYFTDVAAGGLVGTAWGIWHYRYHHSTREGWAILPFLGKTRFGLMASRAL